MNSLLADLKAKRVDLLADRFGLRRLNVIVLHKPTQIILDAGETIEVAQVAELCVDGVVFNLIDAGIFGKAENDSIEDFCDCYEFRDAFVNPFLPKQPVGDQINTTEEPPVNSCDS